MKPGTRQFKTPLRLPEVFLFQGFLKLKERGKLLPAWEELQSTETQKGAALHPRSPAVRESSCIMSGGVSAPPWGRCHCSPPGSGAPTS